MFMIWFAATDEELAQVVELESVRKGIDPFTRAPITFRGPTYDDARLRARSFFEVDGVPAEVVDVLFGPGALIALGRTTCADASDLYRPHLERSGVFVYRLAADARDASARLARGYPGFAARLAERDLDAGATSVSLSAELSYREGDEPFASAEDELIAAFQALLAGAAGRSIFGIEVRD
jgi:hypothetical protein